jgi:hypothetical protein
LRGRGGWRDVLDPVVVPGRGRWWLMRLRENGRKDSVYCLLGGPPKQPLDLGSRPPSLRPLLQHHFGGQQPSRPRKLLQFCEGVRAEFLSSPGDEPLIGHVRLPFKTVASLASCRPQPAVYLGSTVLPTSSPSACLARPACPWRCPTRPSFDSSRSRPSPPSAPCRTPSPPPAPQTGSTSPWAGPGRSPPP